MKVLESLVLFTFVAVTKNFKPHVRGGVGTITKFKVVTLSVGVTAIVVGGLGGTACKKRHICPKLRTYAFERLSSSLVSET